MWESAVCFRICAKSGAALMYNKAAITVSVRIKQWYFTFRHFSSHQFTCLLSVQINCQGTVTVGEVIVGAIGELRIAIHAIELNFWGRMNIVRELILGKKIVWQIWGMYFGILIVGREGWGNYCVSYRYYYYGHTKRMRFGTGILGKWLGELFLAWQGTKCQEIALDY